MNIAILLLQSLFVITNVAPGTVDTQPPVISRIIYCPTTACTAQVNADGAQLATGTNRYEFRVAASDNFAVAYTTLELLKNITDADGALIQFKRGYLGPLPPSFALVWDEILAPGTYYLRVTVFDSSNQPSIPKVFTVKK